MPALDNDDAVPTTVQPYPSEGSQGYSSESRQDTETKPVLRRSHPPSPLRPGVTAEMHTIQSVLPSAWNSEPLSPRSRGSSEQDDLEEPWLKRMISSNRFNMAVGAMICLNTVLMGLELDQHEVASPDDTMLATVSPQNIPQRVFDGFEVTFFVVFVIEFVARLVVYRLPLFLEVSTYVDILALSPIVLLFGFDMQGTRHITMIRVVRLVKLCRLLRLFRLSKELNMLAHSMASASRALLWIGLLLLITVYCAAIACTMVIGHNSSFSPEDSVIVQYSRAYEESVHTRRYWGSMTRSMMTLFQIFTLDDWNDIVRPVVETHQPWMLLFFICFVFITTFGLLNLLMGTIVDRAISIAKEQEEEKDKILSNESKQVMLATVRLFSLIDNDSNGRIAAREIRDFLEHNDLQRVLEKEMSRFKIKMDYSGLMDICLRIAEDWMEACGPDADGITVQEFAGACSRLQGPAKSQDLFAVLVATKSTQARVETFESRLERLEKKLWNLSESQESKFDMLMDMLMHTGPLHRVATENSEISTVCSSAKEITPATRTDKHSFSPPDPVCMAKEKHSFSPPEVPGQPETSLPLRVTAKSTSENVLEGVEEVEQDLMSELCQLSDPQDFQTSSSSTAPPRRQPSFISIKSTPTEALDHPRVEAPRVSTSERPEREDAGRCMSGGHGGLSELLGSRNSLARSGSQRINSLTSELSSFCDLAQTDTAMRMRRYSDVGGMWARSSSRNRNQERRSSRTLTRHLDRSQSQSTSQDARSELPVSDDETTIKTARRMSFRGNSRTRTELVKRPVMSPVGIKECSSLIGSRVSPVMPLGS